MAIDTFYLDGDGKRVKPAREALLQTVQAVNDLLNSGTIGVHRIIGAGLTTRDLGLTENSTHVFASTDFTVLTNATVTAGAGNTVEVEKTGAGGSAGTAAGFVGIPQNADWLLYLKLKLSVGGAGQVAHFNLGPAGGASLTVSLGYDWVAGAAVDGCISAKWGATSVVLQTGADYVTDFVYLLAHYDHNFTGISFYTKNPTTREYTYRARVDGAFTYTQEVRVTFAGTTSLGNRAIMGNVRQFCRPNLMSIGDSICKGSTLHDPNPSVATKNFDSSWQRYVKLSEVENTFIVNKGVGGNDSNQISARIATDILPNKPKRVALHLSTNDYGSGFTVAQRTTYTQDSLNKLRNAGIDVTLLSAVYPNSAAINYPANTNFYRGYMTDPAGFETLTGYAEFVDFMTDAEGIGDPALNYDLDVDYAQADGVHPNPTGYSRIGALVEAAWTGKTTPRVGRNLEVPGSLYVRGLIYGKPATLPTPYGWQLVTYTNATTSWALGTASSNEENTGIIKVEAGASPDEFYVHFTKQAIVPSALMNYGTTGAFVGVARLVSIATIVSGSEFRARYVVRKMSDGSTPTGAELNGMSFYVKY